MQKKAHPYAWLWLTSYVCRETERRMGMAILWGRGLLRALMATSRAAAHLWAQATVKGHRFIRQSEQMRPCKRLHAGPMVLLASAS